MQPYPKTAIIPFALLIKKYAPDLEISIAEVGARPLPGEEEPYMAVLDVFEKAKIYAFEIDEALCAELNRSSHKNLRYYPRALSHTSGTRTLYETVNPACSSLYEADGELMEKYFRLDIAMPKTEHEIPVTTLDEFFKEEGVDQVDMIKIDVQGAELDVFQGAEKAINESVFIVSEVEFIQIYKNQPLFGDVSAHMSERDFMFHKFIGVSGRCLQPIAIHNNDLYASQMMWSDAIFIRHIKKLDALPDDSLYKSALFSFIYGSPDLAFYCLRILDQRNESDLCVQFAKLAQQL